MFSVVKKSGNEFVINLISLIRLASCILTIIPFWHKFACSFKAIIQIRHIKKTNYKRLEK